MRAVPRRPQRQRRSLSMPRSPGRIDRDGDSAIAAALVDALVAAQQDRETAETLTHPFHAYPARLHPATAQRLVALVGDGAQRAQPIVDPFCGSGSGRNARTLRRSGITASPA